MRFIEQLNGNNITLHSAVPVNALYKHRVVERVHTHIAVLVIVAVIVAW